MPVGLGNLIPNSIPEPHSWEYKFFLHVLENSLMYKSNDPRTNALISNLNFGETKMLPSALICTPLFGLQFKSTPAFASPFNPSVPVTSIPPVKLAIAALTPTLKSPRKVKPASAGMTNSP